MVYDRTISTVFTFAPPGHFYSPHPLLEDIESNYDHNTKCYENLAGIQLNVEEQLTLLHRASCLESPGPWQEEKEKKLRYYYDNMFFRFGDATAVWHMAQLFHPRRIIEVGSGLTTACWLDSIDRLGLKSTLQCIEPYPDRVRKSCKADLESQRLELFEQPVQSMSMSHFSLLEKNDVLFIDSTHVAKSGSDVNYLIFNILPHLNSGVLVHFHDIFWPFEYPKDWYLKGRSWNKCFVLRAFLQFNREFRILRFNSYLAAKHHDSLIAIDNRFVSEVGASIWLVKE